MLKLFLLKVVKNLTNILHYDILLLTKIILEVSSKSKTGCTYYIVVKEKMKTTMHRGNTERVYFEIALGIWVIVNVTTMSNTGETTFTLKLSEEKKKEFFHLYKQAIKE